MAKIAIDCDGVLANFGEAFIREANRIFPGRIPKDFVQTSWNYPDDVLTANETDAVWDVIKATPDWWLTLQSYSENMAALATFFLTEYHHDVWIVTSRVPTIGGTVAYQTQLWLHASGIRPHFNYLGIIPVANSDEKIDLYRTTGIKYSVDDKKETIEQCDKLPGHHAFLLDRTWNQDAVVKHRIPHLTQYFKEIDKHEKA